MIRWAAQRPAAIWASAAALLLAGAVAGSRLPLATRPVVELPRLQVGVSWPGASAELVELYLTAPIEAAVQSVRGVRRVDSESQDGAAQLTVTLHPGAGVQLARLAILERLELLRDELPPGAAPPSVGNHVPDELAEQPLLQYTLSGPYTPGTVARFARERIVPRLSAIPGVAGVTVSGGAETGVAVAYDPARLRQLGLVPERLAQALASARLARPLGLERMGAVERPLLLRDPALSLSALAALPVAGPGGRVLALGDVAAVRPDEDALGVVYRVNGEPAVSVSVARLPQADAIRTAAAVRSAMNVLSGGLPPGVEIRLQSDEARQLARQLRDLGIRGAVALLAVILVLAVGLRHARAVGLVLLTAAVSIAGTTLVLYLLRIPANLLTLAGLAMGIGVLVQNGIVVVDRLRGIPDDADARAEAGRRISPAVLGATLTTAAVLLPFLYLQGNARAAFVPFTVAFALALGWSVVGSLVMLPAVGAHRAARAARADRRSRANRAYRRFVVRLLRWRWPALAGVAAAIAVVAWGFVTKVPRWSYGSWYDQRSTLYASVRFPRGSDPVSLDRAIREFEAVAVGRDGVEQVTARGDRDGAAVIVSFTDDAGAVPYVLEEELTRRAILVGGAAVSVRYQGPGFSAGYGGAVMAQRIKLLGYSYDGLRAIAEDLKARLERIPRVRDVDINAGTLWWSRERGFDVTIEPDRAALGRYGLTATDLARAVGREVQGPIGGQRLVVDGEERLVTLKAAGAAERSLSALQAAIVPTAGGAPVPIGALSRVHERETIDRISRQDQQYVRVIGYEFRGPARLAERTHRAFMRSIALPAGYTARDDTFGWGADESARGLWVVFGLGVVLVVLVVAFIFDSVWGTLMVVLGLPVALAGAAAAFWIGGAAFSREAAVGAVLVVGLAVNQVILLVDAALERRRAGAGRGRPLTPAAVVSAASERAGMITLVTLTTLASLIPMAVGADPDQLFGAIALATVGGTAGGTLAALLVLPALLPRLRRRGRSEVGAGPPAPVTG